MKKSLFILVFSILFAGTSLAQVRFGITTGLNFSSFSGDKNFNGDSWGYLVGFQGGLVVDIGITENFSIIPELLYSQRGAYNKYEEIENKKNTVEFSFILNYLQVPVNLAYKLNVGSSKLSLFAGPYVGYALSGQFKTDYNMDGEKESEKEDIEFGSDVEQMKALDYGVNIGAGFEFGSGMFLKLQYNMGLNNLSNDNSANVKNTNVAFTVGYLF